VDVRNDLERAFDLGSHALRVAEPTEELIHNLAYAYALGSLNYVLVPIAARALFGEKIDAGRWLGIALIAAAALDVLYGRLERIPLPAEPAPAQPAPVAGETTHA